MLLYIRHSNDEYKDATYLYDKKITEVGAKDMIKFTEKLVMKYGLPDVIYCSPFRRCRYSVKFMLRHLRNKYNHVPQIEMEPRLSRYFTHKEKLNPQISNNTAKYEVPIYESWGDFKKRNKEIIHKYERYVYEEKKVWVLTHTLVIREVCRHYNIEFPKWIPFLFKIRVKKKYVMDKQNQKKLKID